MKRNIINKLLASSALVLAGGLVSCNDYLTLYPTDSITKEDFWGSKNDVENVRNAAYYQLTQNTTKILVWGEFRSDNVELNKTEKTEYRYLQDGVLQPTQAMFDWASMYKGINFCNEVLDNGERMVRDKVDPSFTEGDFAPIKSEMIALRALYYFYLVRAYRDVPFVEHTVDTDRSARTAKTPATAGADLMGILIQQVEDNIGKASSNYGDTYNNKCRILQNGMHALLADMYLWRAGLVKNAKVKGFPIKDENGAELTADQENALVKNLLLKSVEHAQVVIDKAREDYKQYLIDNNIRSTDYRANVRYPLYRNSDSKTNVSDVAYNSVFGSQYSPESVFELYFDGVNLKNTTIPSEFYGNPSGYSAGNMVAANGLFNVTDKVDVEKGYGKTDLRMASYGLVADERRASATPIIKGAAISVNGINPLNPRERRVSYSYRSNSSQNAHWPVYRLTDVMTIQAEAVARLVSAPFSLPTVDIQNSKGKTVSFTKKTAFELADDIFRRNNPGADTLIEGNDYFSTRIRSPKFEDDAVKNVAEAEKAKKYEEAWRARHSDYGDDAVRYIAAERQREFLGEGKRWFDIVRQCEFTYDNKNKTKGGLDWAGLPTTVRARLQSIWSLYNPIYVEELKVNGKNYGGSTGGQLVQNPAWEKYMPKTNNDN